MNQPDRVPDGEYRGPAPSVSTPLLFLVLLSVAAALSGVGVFIHPEEHPLRLLLLALHFLPVLLAWWLWATRRHSSHLLPIIFLCFIWMQFSLSLQRLILTPEAFRSNEVLNWTALLLNALVLAGGLIYLWVQTRKGKRG